MNHLLSLTVGLALVVTGAQNEEKRNAPARSPDDQFLLQAAVSGTLEVKLGQQAAERATDAEVKQFGKRMSEEHGKAMKDLLALRGQRRLEPPVLSEMPEQQKLWNRLSQLKGAEFDRAYMRQMVENHREAVKFFEKEVKEGKDEAIKTFASTHLPSIKAHLKTAQEINDRLTGTKEKKER